MYSQFKERDVETYIDNELKYLKWNDNSRDMKSCNVFKQRAKTQEQEKALKGTRPDYILYKDNSDEPIAIIEAKKPFEDIHKALNQGIEYAKKIKAPIVFATDGIYTKTYHIKKQKPLILNNEEVDELKSQSLLLNFLQDNIYNSIDKKVIKSRNELISLFKDINNNELQDSGVSAGLERIHMFSNIIFLKVISELAYMEDDIVKVPPKEYLWNNFKNKKGLELVDFLNKQAFDYFKTSYGGEVLSKIDILSGKEHNLNSIINKLDDLWLSDTNTDIKGDAFEYFLRHYGGAETDFGQYFTPRHIVKTITKLLNPQFGEKIYDGFCGTGGMLIESFKHIKKRMPINSNTIKQLKNDTVYGGEKSTMYRVAKMNMILAGDGHSNILRQDSYKDKQTNKFDVVITNIPFGSRMKTDYLPQYGYNGKSAEVCGVLHCLDSLNDSENARAGIIVPEGILFNGNKQYTQLRKDLTEKYSLENIISLPREAFVDANVKSNILIVKKKANKKKNNIWYFNLKNDGYTLDKARKRIDGDNDIDALLSETNLDEKEIERLKKINFKLLNKNNLKEHKYVFLPNQYEEQLTNYFKYETVSLEDLEKKDIVIFLKGRGLSKNKIAENGKNSCILYGELYTLYKSPFIEEVKTSTDIQEKILSKKGDVLIPATTTADANGIAIARCINKDGIIIGSDINIIRLKENNVLNPEYLSIALNYPLKSDLAKFAKGANILHLSNTDIKKIKIPLPSLEEQKTIVNTFKKKEKTIEDKKKHIRLMEQKMEIELKQDFMNDLEDIPQEFFNLLDKACQPSQE